VERIVTRASILLIDGVVGHSGTKRSSSTLGIGKGGTTTEQEGSGNSGYGNTSNNTSSKTSNETYGHSTASS